MNQFFYVIVQVHNTSLVSMVILILSDWTSPQFCVKEHIGYTLKEEVLIIPGILIICFSLTEFRYFPLQNCFPILIFWKFSRILEIQIFLLKKILHSISYAWKSLLPNHINNKESRESSIVIICIVLVIYFFSFLSFVFFDIYFIYFSCYLLTLC